MIVLYKVDESLSPISTLTPYLGLSFLVVYYLVMKRITPIVTFENN